MAYDSQGVRHRHKEGKGMKRVGRQTQIKRMGQEGNLVVGRIERRGARWLLRTRIFRSVRKARTSSIQKEKRPESSSQGPKDRTLGRRSKVNDGVVARWRIRLGNQRERMGGGDGVR